jgi:hypothetical protein
VLSDVREETELDGRPTARDTPGSNLNKGVTVVRVCDTVFQTCFYYFKQILLFFSTATAFTNGGSEKQFKTLQESMLVSSCTACTHVHQYIYACRRHGIPFARAPDYGK